MIPPLVEGQRRSNHSGFMTEEKKLSLHPTSIAIVSLYNELYNSRKEVFFPIHDRQILKIDSIVKTVNAVYFGFDRFPTTEEKASAYFCYIIKNHPVTDGNKRLAVLWLEVFCQISNLQINPSVNLDEFVISVERESSRNMSSLVDFVKKVLFGE